MTRLILYSAAFGAFVAAMAMTFVAIFSPDWISYESTSSSGGQFKKTIGLHRSCSSLDSSCQHFPQYEDCHGEDRYFCSMWRSVGFLMSFAAVVEMATFVAYIVVILGGKQKRETGWKILSFLLMLMGVVQCASMAIVAYLFDNDDRFFVGWTLDKAWALCTASWSIAVVSAGVISLSAYLLAPEDGYEFIQSDRYA